MTTQCQELGGCPDLQPITETVDPVPCAPLTFKSGNYTYTYADGCLTRTRNANPVPDGWYNRVRMVDGEIVDATESSLVVQTLGDPCGTSSGGGTGSSTVSTASCNLLASRADGLYASFNTIDTDYISVKGCGTPGSPVQVSLNASALKSDILQNGLSFNGCGYNIVNGIVTAFVLPIVTITSSNTRALQVVKNGCAVELQPQTVTGGFVYTRPMFCPDPTSNTRPDWLVAIGFVIAGAGNTYTVKFGKINTVAQVPTPPLSFTSLQAAISWLDAATVTACPTAGSPGD